MRWLSVDPATKTGIATWQGRELVSVATLRPLANQKEHDRYPSAVLLLEVASGPVVEFGSWLSAWGMLLAGARGLVIEESFGSQPKSVAQLGFRRGYITRECDGRGAEIVEVNTSKWKKAVGVHFADRFPGHSKGDKAHAIALVERHYGRTLKSDEADAVLIGVWALESRAVRA